MRSLDTDQFEVVYIIMRSLYTDQYEVGNVCALWIQISLR